MRRLSHYPNAETRASMNAAPCRNMGCDLLFATSMLDSGRRHPRASNRLAVRARRLDVGPGGKVA